MVRRKTSPPRLRTKSELETGSRTSRTDISGPPVSTMRRIVNSVEGVGLTGPSPLPHAPARRKADAATAPGMCRARVAGRIKPASALPRHRARRLLDHARRPLRRADERLQERDHLAGRVHRIARGRRPSADADRPRLAAQALEQVLVRAVVADGEPEPRVGTQRLQAIDDRALVGPGEAHLDRLVPADGLKLLISQHLVEGG